MNTQPPSFEPPIRRRSLRSTNGAPRDAQGPPLNGEAAAAPSPGAPQRRSLRGPHADAKRPQTAPPSRPSTHSAHSGQATPPPARFSPSSSPQRRSELRTAAQPQATQPPAFVPAHIRQRVNGSSQGGGHPQAHGPQAASSPHTSARSTPSVRAGARPAPQAMPSRPQSTARPAFPGAPAPRPPQRGRRTRRVLVSLALIAALALGWPLFLMMDANANMGRVDALSSAPATPGTTFLLAGSDARSNGLIQDDTEGARSDSIMLVHIAPNGQEVALSLPRDTWVDIPGYGENKLNAAYAFEGAPLLVSTVESLTGLTVDHYVEVGMGGVANVVDAVGGIELCLDYDVDDYRSELKWTAGCHVSDGRTALAFSRMRYSDPLGDIGRAERQRQVVSQTVKAALSPTTLLWPPSALALERAGAGAITVDNDTGGLDIFTLVRAFRSAGANKMTGTPPIISLNYETSAGSAVLLEDTTAPDFFAKLREGTLVPEDLQHVTP